MRVIDDFHRVFGICLGMVWKIGLSLRVRLLRSLPERFKVDIKVKEGTHQSENAGKSPGSLLFPHWFSFSSSLYDRGLTVKVFSVR